MGVEVLEERPVVDVGESSLEGPEGFGLGVAGRTASGKQLPGAWVVVGLGDRDPVQGGVELAVADAVDSLGRLGCQAGVWLVLTMVEGTSRLRVGKVASCPASCCDLPCALSAM
jgi:hypothetical protein